MKKTSVKTTQRIASRFHFRIVLLLSVLSTASIPARVWAQNAVKSMPVYLFAGQSNMQGNVDPALYSTLIQILNSGSKQKNKELQNALNDWYQNYGGGYAQYAASPQVAALEANSLIKLKKSGKIGKTFLNPMAKVFCTSTATAAQPLATNCGNPFGPELMFGHSLFKASRGAPLAVVKVVQGGSTLSQDWISPSASQNPGPLWKSLSDRIRSLGSNPGSIHSSCRSVNCVWEAFVWFQGENDSFDSASAANYQSNLTHLIADVRKEAKKPTLPVILVKLNYWANSLEFGQQVLAAQNKCSSTLPNVKTVTTNDLSRFYHMDPAAQLIVGDRIANTLKLFSIEGGEFPPESSRPLPEDLLMEKPLLEERAE